jgi:DNA-binding LacI/PurR family transcriptional regulator
MPTTIYRIAEKAGVSAATVSRVLAGRWAEARISAGTAARVKKAAQALDYHPNQTARALRTHRAYVIGLLVPHLADPSFAAVAEGVEQYAYRAGYGTIVGTYEDASDVRGDVVRQLQARPTDGIIAVLPTTQPGVEGALENVVNKAFPIVVVGAKLSETPIDGESSARQTGVRAAQLLIDAIEGKGGEKRAIVLPMKVGGLSSSSRTLSRTSSEGGIDKVRDKGERISD